MRKTKSHFKIFLLNNSIVKSIPLLMIQNFLESIKYRLYYLNSKYMLMIFHFKFELKIIVISNLHCQNVKYF